MFQLGSGETIQLLLPSGFNSASPGTEKVASNAACMSAFDSLFGNATEPVGAAPIFESGSTERSA